MASNLIMSLITCITVNHNRQSMISHLQYYI